MPSVTLDLGRYVTLRPRKDGTHRVFFQVPARLRPPGWLSLIPLPLDGGRRGDLSDLAEVARIQADAAALYAQLKGDRRQAPVHARDLPTLNRLWQDSTKFKAKSPTTQKGYAYHAGLILDWSASQKGGHRAVSTLTVTAIEAFLAVYEDRPTTRRHLKIVFSMLLKHAIVLGWISENPTKTIEVEAPESRVEIWEPSDVEFYMFAVAAAGQPTLAAMILTQWEIGQRMTDVRLFRGTWDWKPGTKAAEYDYRAGVFRFWQSKTKSYVTIPVSQRLQSYLVAAHDSASLYLYRDAATGKPFAENRLSHVFEAIRDVAKAVAGARHLVIRALRHSCVVQLARHEATVPEIASITGHSIKTVEQILSVYLPRDNEVAWNAQAKRGIVTGQSGNERSNGSV